MQKQELKAFCDSNQCRDNAGVLATRTAGIEKIVARGTLVCPDCKHALLWKKPGPARRVSESQQIRERKRFQANL